MVTQDQPVVGRTAAASDVCRCLPGTLQTLEFSPQPCGVWIFSLGLKIQKTEPRKVKPLVHGQYFSAKPRPAIGSAPGASEVVRYKVFSRTKPTEGVPAHQISGVS